MIVLEFRFPNLLAFDRLSTHYTGFVNTICSKAYDVRQTEIYAIWDSTIDYVR